MALFYNLLSFISMILSLYMWIVIASAVITWVNPDPMNPIVRALRGLTEPAYRQIRRVIPTNFGGLDIAPMLLILAILFLQEVVIRSLKGWMVAS
jgi:YggT family protein